MYTHTLFDVVQRGVYECNAHYSPGPSFQNAIIIIINTGYE